MKRALFALFVLVSAFFALQVLNGAGDVDAGVRLRLVNAAGEPLECAATLWSEGEGQRQASELSSQACKEGWLHWSDLTPGDYRVMTQAKGMQLLEKTVRVDDALVDLDEVVLVDGRSVSGRVMLAGEPVDGALILVEGGRRTHSDKDGLFSFRGLPKTALSLRAAAQAGRGAVEISEDYDGSEELLVLLERGRGQGLLGLKFEQKDSGPVVVDLLESTDAADQLERGDRLLRVDGVAVADLTAEEIAQLLAGQVDSKAHLEIERAGERKSLTLNRIDPVLLTQN